MNAHTAVNETTNRHMGSMVARMDAHAVSAFDRETALEEGVNDLARLGYVVEMLVHSFLEDLDLYAKDGSVTARQMMEAITQKREVVYSHASDVEVLSRQLRETFYRKDA